MDLEKRILLFLFLSSIVFGFSLTILPAYLSSIGFTPLEYGLLNAIRSISGLLGALATGVVVDYIGSLPMVIASLSLCAIGFGLMSIPSSTAIFVGATMLSLGGSAQHVSMDVFLSRSFDVEKYEAVYSKTYSVILIGSSVGGFAGWIPTLIGKSTSIVSRYSYSLAIASLLLLATLLPLYGTRERYSVRARKTLIASLKGFRDVCKGVALYLLIAEFIVSLGASMSVRMAGFYFAKKFNVQSNALGTMNGVTNLLMAGLAALSPRISASVGHPIAAYILMCASSIPLLVALTYAPSFAIAAGIYVARSALMNAASPLYTAFTMRVVPSDVRGKISSAMILIGVAGAFVGSIIGGVLMNKDLDAPFRVTAAIHAFYLVFLYAFVVRKSGKRITFYRA